MMLAWVRRLALGTLAVTLAFGASAACGGKDDAKPVPGMGATRGVSKLNVTE